MHRGGLCRLSIASMAERIDGWRWSRRKRLARADWSRSAARSRSRSAARASPRVLLASLTVGAALLVACSGGSGASSAGLSAEDAADQVVSLFGGAEAARPCLVGGFTGTPQARSTLADDGEWSAGQQAALGAVIESCTTPEALGRSVADSVGRSLPPAEPGAAEAQASCIQAEVVAFSEQDRRTLVVGLLALAGPADSELALARGDIVNRLYDACGVTVTGGGDDPGGGGPVPRPSSSAGGS